MKFNLIKKIGFVIVVLATLSTCERDDICPEDVPTTPRMIVEFYNISNQENLKNVPNLYVQGIGNDNAISEFMGTSAKNKIQLPLKTDANSTQFLLINDYAIDDNGTPEDESDDFQTGNEDIITINYITENVYVSRACGYKTIFKTVNIQFDADDTDRWIVLAQPLNDNQSIEDETTTHFKFFH